MTSTSTAARIWRPSRTVTEVHLRVCTAGLVLATHFRGRTLLCPSRVGRCQLCLAELPRFYAYHLIDVPRTLPPVGRADRGETIVERHLWECPEQLHREMFARAASPPPLRVHLGRGNDRPWSVVSAEGCEGAVLVGDDVFAAVCRLFRLPPADPWAAAALRIEQLLLQGGAR